MAKLIYGPYSAYKSDINDLVEDELEKGGPGSGRKGHKTNKPDEKRPAQVARQFLYASEDELTEEIRYREKQGDEYNRSVADELIKLRDRKRSVAPAIPGKVRTKDGSKPYTSPMSTSGTEDARRRSKLKPNPKSFTAAVEATSLKNHPNWNKDDYVHLRQKGYKDHEVKAIWDRDRDRGAQTSGGKPKVPNVTEGIGRTAAKLGKSLTEEEIAIINEMYEAMEKGWKEVTRNGVKYYASGPHTGKRVGSIRGSKAKKESGSSKTTPKTEKKPTGEKVRIVAFKNPTGDEVGKRFLVLEDRGDRLLVANVKDASNKNLPITPTQVFSKKDLEEVETGEDSGSKDASKMSRKELEDEADRVTGNAVQSWDSHSDEELREIINEHK